ncbi:MAG: GNAT family N-acetyltransferase [Dehalococcoidia bacterium]|nr:GNAT family N-acetyltransferase [Dehalococcoidia bacterium]
MPVTIRYAKASDVDALLALYAELSPDNAATGREDAAAALATILAEPLITLLVAEDGDGTPLGTVMVAVLPGLSHGARPWAQVENMVVAGQARGQGVGRELLAACVALARERGCYKVQLQSAEQRRDAHRFYAANGFRDSSAGFRLYL